MRSDVHANRAVLLRTETRVAPPCKQTVCEEYRRSTDQ